MKIIVELRIKKKIKREEKSTFSTRTRAKVIFIKFDTFPP